MKADGAAPMPAANKGLRVPLNPSKSKEEVELSSDDNDERENPVFSVARSTGIRVHPPGPTLVPPVNESTHGNQAGKAVSLASSADIQCQISKQPTSQKNNDANRVPLKPATPGWRPPHAHSGPNNSLMISFSDDDSQSDSEEKECGKLKALQSKSNMTRPPISSLANPNRLGQPARNVDKVMPKKLSANHTFNTSTANIRGINSRDSVVSSVEHGSRAGNFNSKNKTTVNRGRGYELQDLRQQIALKENELKLKSTQRTKESVTCKDDNAKGLHRDGAGKCTTGYSKGMQVEPKEPDKKRLKVSCTFSTQLTALSPQELAVAKLLLPSKTPEMEDITQLDASKIDHLQKENQVHPTESCIVKWQNPNDKYVAGMLGNLHAGLEDGAGIKYIQSDGRGKQMDCFFTPNQAKSLAKMTCIDFPNYLNSVELNHTNTNRGHPEPGSFLSNPTSGMILMRSGDRDKRHEPSFYSTCQALLNNTKLSNCFGNANLTGDDNMKTQSLVQMDEMLDKNLEEAQEHWRRCEIEEQALKACCKAQRALLEANARCDVLHRKRELYSGDFRAYDIGNPNFLCSSRQNKQSGLGLDHTINLSENVNLIPTSNHQMPEHNDCNLAVIDSSIQCVNRAQIPNSYQHLSGENIGSELCSEPDTSTSETVPLLGNNGTNGVCCPSSEPNGSANEDDYTFSFENESAQPNSECHMVDNQKETDNESNRIMSVAKLGTKNVSKNCVVCKGTGTAVEREAENDTRSEEPQNGSSPFSEVEKNQQSDIEGDDGQQSFTEAPLVIQREHSIEHLSLNSHSIGDFEDRCSFGGDHSLTSMNLRTAFGYMKVIDPNNVMEHQDRSQQTGTCDTNIEEGACINCGKVQFSGAMVDPTKKTLVNLCDREDGSYTTGPVVDPSWPLCMYELHGKCNNDECPWQHVKAYSTTILSPYQHDNSEIADCQVGQTSCKEKCDGSAKVPWHHKNQPDQALADNEQYLEKALLIFGQEVNALEGMRKALPVLSRALEENPVCSVAHSTGTSVLPAGPMLVPPVNKFTHGNQAGKAVSSSSSRVSGPSSVEQGSQAGNFNSLKAEAVCLNSVADEKAEAKLCASQLELYESVQDDAQTVQSLDGDNADLAGHGTTNVVIRLKIGVIIAVDSRSVVTHIFSGTNIRVNRIVDDNAMKFKQIMPGVYLTASGSASRNQNLWQHLTGLVSKGMCTEIDSLREQAHTYLKKHPVPSTARHCGIRVFMAGWNRRKKEYVVYRIGDGYNHTLTLTSLYGAAGSGTRHALKVLADRKDIHLNMDVQQAGQAAIHALLGSASEDPNSGGFLRVFFGTKDGYRPLCDRHTMVVIMNSPKSIFLRKELYIIIERLDNSDLSDLLCASLFEFDYHVQVQCLGAAGLGWFLYRAVFDSEVTAERMYLSCQPDPELSWVRVKQFSAHPSGSMSKVRGYVGFASRLLLKRAHYMRNILAL